MIMRLRPLMWTIGSFAIVFVLWALVVRIFQMPQYLLPGPVPVFASLAKNIAVLANQTLWTSATVLIGFVVAALFAIPLAMVIVVSPVLERLLYPPMVATQSIPKIALALAVVGALTGEFVGSDKGLGYLLVQASGNLNTALLFATLVILSALAMAFFYLVEVLERIAIPWHASQRAHP